MHKTLDNVDVGIDAINDNKDMNDNNDNNDERDEKVC